jgi:hypothetical protein
VYSLKDKYAILKPAFKKGDKLLTTNYRPVPFLTSFSKIFENPINSRLYEHICTNNILVKEQYRFKINCSTEAASYNVIYEILKAMNKRLAIRGVKIRDLEKAFVLTMEF